MKKKSRIIGILWIFCGAISYAQQLSNQVITPIGGVVSNNGIFFSHTIGETAVELFSTPWHDLTQGFQQPSVKFMPGTKPQGNGVKVYPNPAVDNISVELFGDQKGSFSITVINVVGTIVFSDNVNFIYDYWQIINIPVGSLSRGLYFVRVISDDGRINRTFKIDKL